jgi:hypothetical protein
MMWSGNLTHHAGFHGLSSAGLLEVALPAVELSGAGLEATKSVDYWRLPRYLQEENQLKERDWEILQHLERILSAFGVVVKRLEGDGQIRTRRDGREKSYGNIWKVILAFERLLSKLKELKH